MITKVKDTKRNKLLHGFTLIELTMTIAFISLLLLAIGATTSGVINAYRKGITMKDVNSAGRELIEEFSTAIQESPSLLPESICLKAFDDKNSNNYKACVADEAYGIIFQQWYTKISIDGSEAKNAPVFGAFCTGKYSYIWNTGYTFNGQNSNYNTEYDSQPPYITYNDQQFHLLKFNDPTLTVCSSIFSAKSSPGYEDAKSWSPTSLRWAYVLPENGEELLNDDHGTLAIYDFVVYRPIRNSNTKQSLYSASLILATISGGVNILSSGDYCKPPSELELTSDFSYCAINKFNFAMRATGV